MIKNGFTLLKKMFSMNTVTPQEDIFTCTKNIEIAIQLLKKITINQKTAVALPWYLLIGPTDSGKTTWLANAELDFIQSSQLIQKTPANLPEQKQTNWWATAEALLLDVPGRYFSAENAETVAPHFLTLVRKEKKIAGVIFIVDITTFLNQAKTAQQQTTHFFKRCLDMLIKNFKKPFTVDVVFTKFDCVAGFKDFFAELDQEERAKPLGVVFPPMANNHQDFYDLFNAGFEQLLQRLRERLIWRLHQEHNLSKRTLIKDFTSQVESLKTPLSHFIYQLYQATRYHQQVYLQGFYFCSSRQSGEVFDGLAPALSQSFELPPISTHFYPKKEQAFFIKHLLNPTIFSNAKKIMPYEKTEQDPSVYQMAYYGALIVIVSAGIWFVYDYKRTTNQIITIHRDVANYQALIQNLNDNNLTFNQLLPILGQLKSAVQTSQGTSLPWLLNSGLYQHSPLEKNVGSLYQKVLQNQFIRVIQKTLEQQLQIADTSRTYYLYNTLKIYLMLGDPTHFQPDVFKSWFYAYWQRTLGNDPTEQQLLKGYLNDLLSSPLPAIHLNQSLISEARQELIMMPEPLLAYLLLKDRVHSLKSGVSFAERLGDTQGIVFNDKGYSSNIMEIYDPARFQKIYAEEIPSICNEMLSGNWVIGNRAIPTNNKNRGQYLVKEVKDLYLADYTEQQKHLLDKLQIVEFENISQTEKVLEVLSHPDSPLIKASLILAQTDKSQPNITVVLPTLQKLKTIFDKIATHGNTDQAAFEIAKERFSNNNNNPITELHAQANLFSDPVKTWLNTIANQSWKLILQCTRHYVNSAWNQQIIPFYKEHLKDRYPLLNTAELNVEPSHFSHFFAPKGLMENYFNTYLQTFVDTQGGKWQWRTIDGLSLSNNSNSMLALEQAALIRHMFYSNNANAVASFILQPIAFAPHVKRLTIGFNGENIIFDAKTLTPRTLFWTDNLDNTSVSLRFENEEGRTAEVKIDGPWAWFRLLQQAHIQTSDDTQHFSLLFDLNGNSGRYQLIANRLMNPFVPGIVDHFRCPESL